MSILRSVLLDIFIKCDTTRRCFSSHFRFILLQRYALEPKISTESEDFADGGSFRAVKSYLDRKVESLASGLVSQTTGGTQKLERAAEAGKLKFQGNKDQFLFNCELQGTLDDTANSLAAWEVEKVGKKVEELKKRLRHRQKTIKLADKSEAGWLAVKE